MLMPRVNSRLIIASGRASAERCYLYVPNSSAGYETHLTLAWNPRSDYLCLALLAFPSLERSLRSRSRVVRITGREFYPISWIARYQSVVDRSSSIGPRLTLNHPQTFSSRELRLSVYTCTVGLTIQHPYAHRDRWSRIKTNFKQTQISNKPKLRTNPKVSGFMGT